MWNYATPCPERTCAPVAERRRSRWAGAALVLAAILLLAGCPYSGVPLGEPDASTFEHDLVGEWTITGDSAAAAQECTDPHDTLTFRQFNRAEYLVSMVVECRLTHTRAFATRVGGALFLNVEDDSLSAKRALDSVQYMLVRVELRGEELLLHTVSEDLETGQTTSARLREVLLQRLDDPATYDGEPLRLRRKQR